MKTKIYRATCDVDCTGGCGIVVDALDAEEKAKTFRIISNGISFTLHKDEVGRANLNKMMGYGTTAEEAVRTLRRSADITLAFYQEKIDMCRDISAKASEYLRV